MRSVSYICTSTKSIKARSDATCLEGNLSLLFSSSMRPFCLLYLFFVREPPLMLYFWFNLSSFRTFWIILMTLVFGWFATYMTSASAFTLHNSSQGTFTGMHCIFAICDMEENAIPFLLLVKNANGIWPVAVHQNCIDLSWIWICSTDPPLRRSLIGEGSFRHRNSYLEYLIGNLVFCSRPCCLIFASLRCILDYWELGLLSAR